MIERLAARLRGLKGNGQLFFGLRLTDKPARQARPKFEFKALFLFGARGADEPFRRVVASDGHAGRSVAGGARRGKVSGTRLRLAVLLQPLASPSRFSKTIQ